MLRTCLPKGSGFKIINVRTFFKKTEPNEKPLNPGKTPFSFGNSQSGSSSPKLFNWTTTNTANNANQTASVHKEKYSNSSTPSTNSSSSSPPTNSSTQFNAQYKKPQSKLQIYTGKVYTDVAKYLGVTAISGTISGFAFVPLIELNPPLAFGTWLLCAGGSIYQAFQLSNTHKTYEQKKVHAYIMHALMGVTISPSLVMFHDFIPHALIATTALTAGPIMMALKTPSPSLLPYGMAMYSCLGGLVGVGFLSLFFPALHSIDVYGGVVLFTLYNAYDTHIMIDDFNKGKRDIIMHATNYSLNIINLFIRLLEIFAKMQQAKSKKN